MLKYKQIVDNAYKEMKILGQNKSELLNCVHFIERFIKPKNILEIGSQFGGTFYCWASLATGKKISVDLTAGPFGGVDKRTIEDRNKKLSSLFKETYFIDAKSQEITTFNKVRMFLGNEKLDFIFIDGDHSYSGVSKDYYIYRQLVRKGGWIGFHDINEIEEDEVDKLWKELEGKKIEFNDHTSWVDWRTNLGGIGLIQI